MQSFPNFANITIVSFYGRKSGVSFLIGLAKTFAMGTFLACVSLVKAGCLIYLLTVKLKLGQRGRRT